MSNEERVLTLEFKKNLLKVKEMEAKKILEEGNLSVEKFLNNEAEYSYSYGSAFHPLSTLKTYLKEIDELRDQIKELTNENVIIY